MGREGRSGFSYGGGVENDGLWWTIGSSKGCALLLLHAGAGGDDSYPTNDFNEEERLTMLKEEFLFLDDDCCYWRRREVVAMAILVIETCDREREGVGGGPAGAKGGKVVSGYATIFLHTTIVSFSLYIVF